MNYPVVLINKNNRIASNYPWVFANEIHQMQDYKNLTPGALVKVCASNGDFLAIGYFNPHSLIAIRILTRKNIVIDSAWLYHKLQLAMNWRNHCYQAPFYRLVYGEVDLLPGIVIDRYDNYLVLELNTAGSEQLAPMLLEAIAKLLPGSIVVVKREQAVRKLENLPIVNDNQSQLVQGIENNVKFLADIGGGQKTGWFYDQRDNRALLQQFCFGKKVLDCFSFSGSFGLYAKLGGAEEVIAVDASSAALELAQKNAALNNIAFNDYICMDAFLALGKWQQYFDIAVIDPPAFVKSKKDYHAGKRGYIKLLKQAKQVVKTPGLILFTSCSYHINLVDLQAIVGAALEGYEVKILKTLHAGMDHPIHPLLAESAYLKGFLLAIDK